MGAEATLPLRREATDGVRDYWSAVLPVPSSRLRYFFMLRGKVGEPTFLSEQGFSDRPPRSANYVGYFFYPYDQPTDRFALPTANHVFLPGHRIMVQIQSTWFPLYDRNPQTFVPNIFWAKPADYRKATQRIYHAPGQATFIELPLITTP